MPSKVRVNVVPLTTPSEMTSTPRDNSDSAFTTRSDFPRACNCVQRRGFPLPWGLRTSMVCFLHEWGAHQFHAETATETQWALEKQAAAQRKRLQARAPGVTILEGLVGNKGLGRGAEPGDKVLRPAPLPRLPAPALRGRAQGPRSPRSYPRDPPQGLRRVRPHRNPQCQPCDTGPRRPEDDQASAQTQAHLRWRRKEQLHQKWSARPKYGRGSHRLGPAPPGPPNSRAPVSRASSQSRPPLATPLISHLPLPQRLWACSPFPGLAWWALVGKNPPANAGDVKDAGSIPGSGRAGGGGRGNPLQYACLENPMDRGAWLAPYSPWDRKECDTTEAT